MMEPSRHIHDLEKVETIWGDGEVRYGQKMTPVVSWQCKCGWKSNRPVASQEEFFTDYTSHIWEVAFDLGRESSGRGGVSW